MFVRQKDPKCQENKNTTEKIKRIINYVGSSESNASYLFGNYMKTITDTKTTTTLFDRANSHLQNIIFQRIHPCWLRIFPSNEREPVFHARKNLHQQR